MDPDTKELLRQQTLFSASGDDVLTWASERLRIVEHKASDHICWQGDPRSPLVLVMSGQLRASTNSEGSVEIPMGLINPGQSAGASSIIQGLPCFANIGVVRRSMVGLLNRADARHLFNDSNILRALTTKIAFQLRDFYEREATQGLSRADARISAVIESSISSATSDGFPVLELPNQATIAAMAKVSRETVSRIMSSLELQGVIAKKGRWLHVRDRATLHQLATGKRRVLSSPELQIQPF